MKNLSIFASVLRSRLMVRTNGFQPLNMGSSPVGAAKSFSAFNYFQVTAFDRLKSFCYLFSGKAFLLRIIYLGSVVECHFSSYKC